MIEWFLPIGTLSVIFILGCAFAATKPFHQGVWIMVLTIIAIMTAGWGFAEWLLV